MGQEEITQILKKNKNKWFSTKELAEMLNVNSGSVTRAAKKLRWAKFIDWKIGRAHV